ncbi:uncharacterized protein KD926_008967 [Aspergillus affinis]|uniref:uncharacterized protein n=1 Tax=Aspergillus affinis TaxID=1070780 RepID=UPI0022FE5D5D|nr:uncharacterized protein KD926_008967 [Aspergillus affinis]KAI9039866.1 hypothetical protein KD926_008967 [Aspergillus affinis]
MASESLWKSAWDVVAKMRDIIQNESPERVKESKAGWQYRLLDECKAMKADMESRGYKVHDCTVFHFLLTAKIENPTKRLLLIPIQGTSTLTPTEDLSPGSYFDIRDDVDRVLTPDQSYGADIAIVTLD